MSGFRAIAMCLAALVLTGCAHASLNRFDDVARYDVRNPLAGYFDLEDRRALVRSSTGPVFVALRAEMLGKAPTCEEAKALRVHDELISIPRFHPESETWREEMQPLWDIGHAVARLAGANLIAQDRRHAECLLDLLMVRAGRDALMTFHVTETDNQSWLQIDSILFGMALALSAVQDDLRHRPQDMQFVINWLVRASRNHLAIEGGENGTCCNNHFYRRALHGTIIGILANDDELFRVGVKAIYMALQDALPDGGLPLELKRGARAVHHQNLAVMHLVMIAHLMERQGYPIWDLAINGKTLHTLVGFNTMLLRTPELATRFTGTREVDLGFMDDPQYLAWMEIYLSKFRNPDMEQWVAERQPLYNRNLGGYLTAYFYNGH